MPQMAHLAAIDVGLSFVRPTTGICQTCGNDFRVGHTYADKPSRAAVFGKTFQFDILAIDGPVLPGRLHYQERSCEQVLTWRPFQRRCKPGLSHIPGTGQALRRAGCDTAGQFEIETRGVCCAQAFPRVLPGRNIVEAFPNAFLGVLLEERFFQKPGPGRGKRFNWLLDGCRETKVFSKLREHLDWDEARLWEALKNNEQHDEQAALVCALTAICVWKGEYVAVGEPVGGYFFLPPWSFWQDWARDGLVRNRRDRRLDRPVDVWISGRAYTSASTLPQA